MFPVIWCRNASGAFASPAPLFSLFFFSFNFLEHIQGSDKGFNGILRAPLLHLLTHGCMLRHPFYLVNFSTSHFTVLSVGCSVSIFARETCVWLSKWLYCAISILMMCFRRDLHGKSNRAEGPCHLLFVMTVFLYVFHRACWALYLVLSVLIDVNRECSHEEIVKTPNSPGLLMDSEDLQAALAFQTARWNVAWTEVAVVRYYYY